MTYPVLDGTIVAAAALNRIPMERSSIFVVETLLILRPVGSWASQANPGVLNAYDRAVEDAQQLCAEPHALSPYQVRLQTTVGQIAQSDPRGAASLTMELAGVMENALKWLSGQRGSLAGFVESDLQLVAYVERALSARPHVTPSKLDAAALSVTGELRRAVDFANSASDQSANVTSAEYAARRTALLETV